MNKQWKIGPVIPPAGNHTTPITPPLDASSPLVLEMTTLQKQAQGSSCFPVSGCWTSPLKFHFSWSPMSLESKVGDVRPDPKIETWIPGFGGPNLGFGCPHPRFGPPNPGFGRQIQDLDIRIQDFDIQIWIRMNKSRIWTSKF